MILKEFNKSILFDFNDEYILLEKDQLRLIYNLYSKLGQNKTKKEVYTVLQNDLDLSYKDFESFLTKLKITKTTNPIPWFDNSSKETIDLVYNLDNDLQYIEYLESERDYFKKENKKLQDKVYHESNFNSKVESKLKTIPILKDYRIDLHNLSKVTEDLIPIVCISDLHVGKIVKSTKDGNVYDKTIIKKRFDKLKASIQNNPEYRYSETIIVALLGDLLESVLGNMHENQSAHIDLHGVDQIAYCADIIQDFIMWLLATFKRPIKVYGIGGNHDRLSVSRNSDHIRSGFQILSLLLSTFFKSYTEAKVVELNLSEDNYLGFDVFNTRVILIHGDRKVDNLRLISSDNLSRHFRKNKHTVIMQGHYHKYAMSVDSVNRITNITCPSTVGSDEYSSMWGLHNRPAQMILDITDKGPNAPSVVFLD